jgi:hypothetical protein
VQSFIFLNAAGEFSTTVSCGAGEIAAAGGYSIRDGAATSESVKENHPIEDFSSWGWRVSGTAVPAAGPTLIGIAFVTCLTLAN